MRAGVVFGIVLASVLTSGCEGAEDSKYYPGSYRARESGIAVRNGGAACAAQPGTGTCNQILLRLREGQRVFPICQRRGQLVGRNSYWLYADGPRGNRGWVASWYLDYPSNRLPGVPDCTAELLSRG